MSKDLPTNAYEAKKFDAIFICNGHHSNQFIPKYEGLNGFVGHKMHSHDYRRPDQYEDETVLIVGAGPSGRDIVYEVATKAKRVIMSHHRNLGKSVLPSNVEQVGDIKRFKANSVQFVNDEEQPITCILFCTGE